MRSPIALFSLLLCGLTALTAADRYEGADVCWVSLLGLLTSVVVLCL